MATVDLGLMEEWLEEAWTLGFSQRWANLHAIPTLEKNNAALIHRVEQYEKAREEAETLCKEIAVGWHRSTLSQMIYMSREQAEKWMEKYSSEALKDEPDSVD